jgi:hypothetical protein
MLSAALVTISDFPGNPWFGNERVKGLAEAGLSYLTAIQNRDGSFGEFFPGERSIPATAFTLFAAVRSCGLLACRGSRIERMLVKAARFLMQQCAEDAANQEAASVLAVFETAEFLSDDSLLHPAHEKIGRFLQRQNPSGFFPEYGGADIGYSSVCLDMLAELYRHSRDSAILTAAERLLDALSAFVHPDGSCGGEYGSRDTRYFLPLGLEYLAGLGHSRAELMRNMLFSKSSGLRSVYHALDDRYLCHYVLHSFLRAQLLYSDPQKGEADHGPRSARDIPDHELRVTAYHEARDPALVLRCRSAGETYFPDEGLLSVRTDTYYLVAAGAKGAVCRIYAGNNLFYIDCGYRIQMRNRLFTTFFQSAESSWEKSGTVLRCASALQKLRYRRISPLKRILLYLAALFYAHSTSSRLKALLIKQKEVKNMKFTRRINYSEDRVELWDSIEAPHSIEDVYQSPPYVIRRVPSSKFDAYDDPSTGSVQAVPSPIRVPSGCRRLRIHTEIDIGKGTVEKRLL